MSEPELNRQQKSFVHSYTTGLSPQQAATKAGYSPSYCRKASKLLKHPMIAAAIEDKQAALRVSQGYGPAEAVLEIDRMMKGALGSKVPNHMAAAKLMELKCKIFGFVRERVEIATVDLKGAMEKAQQRVIVLKASTPSRDNAQLTQTPETPVIVGSAVWETRIPGNRPDSERAPVES